MKKLLFKIISYRSLSKSSWFYEATFRVLLAGLARVCCNCCMAWFSLYLCVKLTSDQQLNQNDKVYFYKVSHAIELYKSDNLNHPQVKTILWWSSNAMVLLGTMAYSFVKSCEMKEEHNTSKSERISTNGKLTEKV